LSTLVHTKSTIMVNIKSLLLTVLTSFLIYFPGFTQMDTPPQPYGGNTWMREFICNEMIYPEKAMTNKIEGTVEVTVTVMQDGKTTNYRIPDPLSPELDQEAMRISRLILFYPAVKSSNFVIEDVNIPVKFNIKKYQRNCKKMAFEDFQVYSGPVDTSLTVYPTKTLDQAPRPVFLNPAMDFGKFIAENMKYPELAFRQNITGDVEMNFIVETSGRISNLEVVKPLGGGCTEEAINLLKQVHWKPGIIKGKAVRTFLSASISFSLDNNSDHRYLPNNNNTTM